MTEIYLQFMCAHGQTSWGRPLMASSCTVYRVQLLREHASEALVCAKTCMTDIGTIMNRVFARIAVSSCTVYSECIRMPARQVHGTQALAERDLQSVTECA